jgi:hypothetical protein
LPRLWPIAFCVVLAVLLGCSGAQIESAHFGPSTAIERAITRHFERYASEGNCFNPYIDGFTRLTALEDTPDRLVVHARYFYRDRFQQGGAGAAGRSAPDSTSGPSPSHAARTMVPS